MMINRQKLTFALIATVCAMNLTLAAVPVALAVDDPETPDSTSSRVIDDIEMSEVVTGGSAGLAESDNPSRLIGQIIKGFLGLLGLVFTVLTIYAGWLWMSAAGNEEQITKAKKILTSAVIGLIIIVLAYSITDFVLTRIYAATEGGLTE